MPPGPDDPAPKPVEKSENAQIISDIIIGGLKLLGEVLHDGLKPDPNAPAPPAPPPPCHLPGNPPINHKAENWAFTTAGSVAKNVREALVTCASECRNCAGQCKKGLFETIFGGGPYCLPVVKQDGWGNTAKYLIGRKARFFYKCDCQCMEYDSSFLFSMMSEPYWQTAKPPFPPITGPDGHPIDIKTVEY